MLKMLQELSKDELKRLHDELAKEYSAYMNKHLSLDMSRGKPSAEQLDLSEGVLGIVKKSSECFTEDNVDCRNYGGLEGIREARELFAQVLGVDGNETIVGDSSSLNMMYDTVSRAMLFGVYGSERPWVREKKISFLCPVPGYDRHFFICQNFGINMINIPTTNEGPDMDLVEEYVSKDESIKGIWCVPRFSNPEGKVYSDAVVRRFSALTPKAPDFRIFWDNAYAVHELEEGAPRLLNLMDELKRNGKEDMLFTYTSTSKITFPGGGLAAMGASRNNIELIMNQMSAQTIGPNKINQLRHIRYFKNFEGLKAHMKLHANILKPRFDIVLSALSTIKDLGIAEWTEPKGGYFVSVDLMDGCAKRTVQLLKDAGVKMTPAGATFPYGIDPRDRNIRIAPTYPPEEELKVAMDMFCLCAKISCVENLLSEIED